MVTISGTGFDPQAAYTVSINGRTTPAFNVTASGLDFAVPAGADSGPIGVSDGAMERFALDPYVVTRIVPGRLLPPDGVGHQGYKIIAYQSVAEPSVVSAAEASFVIEAPLDQPVVVWAVRSEEDPPLLAMVTSDDVEVVIDAASTAVALALINPAIAARQDSRAREIKTLIAREGLAADLTAFLEANARFGGGYLDDNRYQEKLLVLLQEILIAEQEEPVLSLASVEPAFPENTLIKPINREYLLSELTTQLLLHAPTAARPNAYLLEVKVGSRFSSVDWIIEVFRLRTLTFDFPNGMQDVRALTYTNTPAFLNTTAVTQGLLAARLDTARVDYIGNLIKFVVSKLESAVTDTSKLAPNQLLIPAGDAIYMVQAYSGNVFWRYGGQEYIIDQHDPNNSWLIALAGNTFIAVVDVSAMFIDFKKLTGVDDLGFITSQVKALEKALAASLVDGQLSADDYMNLVAVALKAFISHAFSKIVDRAIDEGIFATFTSVAGNVARSGFDVFKKVSSGLQVVERTGGLLLPGRLAVERSVVVIGDPFPPVIKEIAPRSARKGETMAIIGRNLPALSHGVVEFCAFAPGAPPDAVPVKQLAAPVLSRSSQAIAVSVPTNFESVFSEGDTVYLRVIDGAKSGDSRPLGSQGVFTYVPPPVLVGVRPDRQVAAGPLTLEGRNLLPAGAGEYEVIIDGDISVDPSRIGQTTVSLLLPSAIEPGVHSLALLFRGELSNTVSFEVVEPPDNVGDLTQGVTIVVTQPDWSNNREDGKISLLEALLIANGQLPIGSLQQHLPCELLPADDPNRCEWQIREIDWVLGEEGAAGGLFAGDTIVLDAPLKDLAILPTSTLPSPGPGDTVYALDFNYNPRTRSYSGGLQRINVFVDGQNIPGESPGFHLNDLFGVTLRDLRFRNFPGDTIRIEGGGEHELLNLVIENGGGSGVVLADTTANRLGGVTVTNSGGNGIRLTGASSQNRIENVTVSGAALSGVLLDGAAVENRLQTILSEKNGLHGLHLSGAGVRGNQIHGGELFETLIRGLDIYRECEGYGVLIDGGASDNTVCPFQVIENGLGGIALKDAGTSDNYIGWHFKRGFPNTQHTRVYGNSGPGVYLGPGVQGNTVNHVTVAGNTGDGILLEGPDCSFNNIAAVWTGFDIFAQGGPVAMPNLGNGIGLRAGASENLIGSLLYQTSYSHRSFIANNALNGILIEGEGTDRNRVIRADLGYTAPASYYFGNQHSYPSNGLDGIAIRDGARENVIGNESLYLDLHIFASGGAGIRLAGAGTDDNLVMNCHIGRVHTNIELPPEHKNRFGIVIENGAKRNVIGALGSRRSFSVFPFTLEFGNTIVNSLEAGIVLDGCGGLLGADGAPGEANLIQNNLIGVHSSTSSGNPVGILITGNSRGNVIGGMEAGTANTIAANARAGIHIHNNSAASFQERTLIAGNTITRGGVTVADPDPLNVLEGPPHGVGILVSGNSSDNVLGETFAAMNSIHLNVCGIYLDGDQVLNTLIRGNQVGSFNVQPAGGIIVRGGAGAVIGGDSPDERNHIRGNGAANDPSAGGVLIAGGQNHLVQNNRFETQPGHGLILHGAADCTVGGSDPSRGNVFVSGGGHGILLTAAATGNVIQNNHIGTERRPAPGSGNQGSGIAILGGSQNNVIGGAYQPSNAAFVSEAAFGNVIAFNGQHGVLVDDSSGNSILYNSIHDNALKGIELTSGGNDGIPPPVLVSFGTTITGTVPDLVAAPPGSRIQIFSDGDAEGETFLGETDVKPGGHWSFSGVSLIPSAMLTATATHPDTRSTSPFASGFPLVSTFQMRRAGGGEPESRFLSSSVSRTVAHEIEAQAGAFPVMLRSLTLRAGGDLPVETAVASVVLVLDANANGIFDEADRELSPPEIFSGESGDVTLHPAGFVIPENSVRRLLVVYTFNQPVPLDLPFDLRIVDAQAVVAETILPVNQRVPPLAQFPIESDLLAFMLSSGGFADWRTAHFNPAELENDAISGPGADPDGDNIINALEYAFGLNPRVADTSGIPRLYRNAQGRLAYEYQRRKPEPGLAFDLRFTTGFTAWFDDNGYIDHTEILELSEEVERVTLILNETTLHLFLKLDVHIEG